MVLLALALTGALSAYLGGARWGPAVIRLVAGGAIAMAVISVLVNSLAPRAFDGFTIRRRTTLEMVVARHRWTAPRIPVGRAWHLLECR